MKRYGSWLANRRNHFIALALLLVIFHPSAAHAYAGPGAGFAVLSSFWSIFVAFLYSAYAFITWPFRQLYRLIRGRKAYRDAKFKRVVILGFDGMDPELAGRYMDEGKLPNLSKLREQGTFRPLRTTFPAISPVAWSTFQTGCNPGKHNIYDFLARDAESYLPYLSSAQIKGPKRRLKVGRYSIPIGSARISQLRRAKPFWHWLGDHGIFCSVIRVPVTFPPEKFSGVLLSGMCVPDLKGSQGTFCFHTTRNDTIGTCEGGVRMTFEQRNGDLHSYIPGPDDPLIEKPATELRVPFVVRPNRKAGTAQIEVGEHKFALKIGEYSEWLPITFKTRFGLGAHGICRFNLRQLEPDVQVYVTPVNVDPQRPDIPISHPNTYSVYLSKLFGPYSTLGLAEDTWALNEAVLDDQTFLQQCMDNYSDREQMFLDALEKTPKGVCVCVFDTTDRVQHMFWRYVEANHPARKQPDTPPDVIAGLYERVDSLVGRVMSEMNRDSLLMVVSDHGFKNFARGVNLNSWLHQNGYLALKPGASESGDWFRDVDWSRTRAYTMGLNGLYLNIQGRESHGIVKPGAEAAALKEELRKKINGMVDRQFGKTAISGVFDCDAVYAGPYAENAPDLLVGYADGYRASWDAVTGKVTSKIMEDNTKAWSGDHCIDPRLVPGVLFSNHQIAVEKPAIVDVAPTILKLFGLERPAHMDGRPWQFGKTSQPAGEVVSQEEELAAASSR
jgi:predicted AlkP superfamily phosphohydrolase/phosphomutase